MIINITIALVRLLFVATLITGCSSTPATMTTPSNHLEHLVFTLNNDQAACTTPAPLTIKIMKPNQQHGHFELAQDSPYNDIKSLQCDKKTTGIRHYADIVTTKSGRTIELHGEYDMTTHINSGTWKDKQNCTGTFLDTAPK